MITLSAILSVLVVIVKAEQATEAVYKGQFCTDPRTMRKHAAYTEWADAYSCTRHRCQPGGRNLAIYTVGCKRVEAPESAIECEEVVEDTNMQFPYCCTRLRCLVVVRGEVWTRVLGQPWETLPAAPWSHMYKMKKPPPADGSFLPKTDEGPVYELQTEPRDSDGEEKVLRSKKTDNPECQDAVARAVAAPTPDIVIALSTDQDKDATRLKDDNSMRYKRGRNQNAISSMSNNFNYDDQEQVDQVDRRAEDIEDSVTEKEKQPHQKQAAWTEIPQSQWNEHDPALDNEQNMQSRSSWNERDHEPEALRMTADTPVARMQPTQNIREHDLNHQPEASVSDDKKDAKPGNLQALVDAIGTRMKDIESVVARMSEKVQEKKPPTEPELGSAENQLLFKSTDNNQKRREGADSEYGKMKKISPENEHYKSHGSSKYLRGSGDATTEQPLFVEDTNLNGYFSDASNTVLRRSGPKEPADTYMAPIESRRKSPHSDNSEELEKKHKKRVHKKKKAKGHHKKHKGKEDKRKKFRQNSVESARNGISLEDSSAVVSNYPHNETYDNMIS